MTGREDSAPTRAAIVYCLVPRELAPKLHELLRRHFREAPEIEVVVERRVGERRAASDRRADRDRPAQDEEQRLIRSRSGRRAGERRAPLLPVPVPELPRKARPFSEQIVFVERLVPSDQEAEDLDTARLVMSIQAGDSDAFAVIYTRYFDRVYAYLRALLRDAHEAEDVAQQVFMAALDSLPRYELRAQPFRAWLFVIVRNHALNLLRARARIDLEDPRELARQRDRIAQAPELSVLNWILDSELTMFIDRLPFSQRQVLLMRFMLDLSTSEIAVIVGRTPADVRKLQHRALLFLRQRLTLLGRAPNRQSRRGLTHRPRQAIVLRERRFALFA